MIKMIKHFKFTKHNKQHKCRIVENWLANCDILTMKCENNLKIVK